MSSSEPTQPPPLRPFISPIRKARFAVSGSILVGIFVVTTVAPDLHSRISERLPGNEHAALALVALIYGGIGFLVIVGVVLTWRRLERWRLGRQTWHRRPSQPPPPAT